jgi:DNA-binding response OmpR family regulator
MKTTILVVENHPDLRTEIVAALNREDFECEGVSTGAAAMLKLREHGYQYILLDVDGPTAGSTLFNTLAAEPAGLDSLILITDSDATEDVPASAAGCARLCKPFDTKQLLARIKR